MFSLLQLLNSLLQCPTFHQEGEINPVKIKCSHTGKETTQMMDAKTVLIAFMKWPAEVSGSRGPQKSHCLCLARFPSQPTLLLALCWLASSLPGPGAAQQRTPVHGLLTAVLVSCCQLPKDTAIRTALRRTHELWMTGNLTILIFLSPHSCLMMSKSPRSSGNYKRLEKPLKCNFTERWGNWGPETALSWLPWGHPLTMEEARLELSSSLKLNLLFLLSYFSSLPATSLGFLKLPS